MNKRDYQTQERVRCERAAANASPIVKLTVLDGKFHVIGMKANGVIVHEKFEELASAIAYTESLTAENDRLTRVIGA